MKNNVVRVSVTESNIDKFQFKDVLKELKAAPSFSKMTPSLTQLQGLFSGQVLFDDKTKTPWDMEVEFAGQISSGKLMGQLRVQLSENGQAFSTSRGDGDLKDLRQLEDGDGIFITTGESNVFQLYYITDQDMFIGHHYKKVDIGDYKHSGTVTLKRF